MEFNYLEADREHREKRREERARDGGGGESNAPLEPRLRTYRAPENGFLRGGEMWHVSGKGLQRGTVA